MAQQNSVITETLRQETARLRSFIRKHVPHTGDAEDILQEVFYELVSAYRLPEPLEHVGAWLYRVAKNRIIDRFRQQKATPMLLDLHDDEAPWLDTLLPSDPETPASLYEKKMLIERVLTALNQLPAEQRSVFIAHEIEGVSFKTLSAESGVPINTLLARKRYAVLFLRAQLLALDPT